MPLESVSALVRPAGDNFGGLLDLQLFLASDLAAIPVAGIPDHDGVALRSPLQFRSGITIAAMYFTPGTASYSEDSVDSDQGESYKWKIPFWVPKNVPELKYWLDQVRGRDLMALVRDTNGERLLFGTPGYPLSLKYELDSGGKPSGRNGSLMTLSGESRDWALHYIPFPTPPPPRKVFSSGFSYGFLRTP